MEAKEHLVKRIKYAYVDCDDDLVGPLDTKHKTDEELHELAWQMDVIWWTTQLRKDFRAGLAIGRAPSTVLPDTIDSEFVHDLVRYINNADLEFFVFTTWIGRVQLILPVPKSVPQNRQNA